VLKASKEICLSRDRGPLKRRVKMAAAHEGKSVKEFLVDLAQARLGRTRERGHSAEGEVDIKITMIPAHKCRTH